MAHSIVIVTMGVGCGHFKGQLPSVTHPAC